MATTTSPSGTGSAAASPCIQEMSGRTLAATASIAGLMSTPVTASAPAISAAVRATIPVPHATSRIRWPGATPATVTNCWAHSANIAGTNFAS